MPTARPRHMITETDEIASAIDVASTLWPESHDERAELLRRIIAEGAARVVERAENRDATRRTAVETAAGRFTGMWPADWRAQRDAEWPE